MKYPTSRGKFQLRVAWFDLWWALVVPPIALLLGNAAVVSTDRAHELALYWATSVACSVVAFVFFRIRDGLASYFSVHDALDVAKAVILAHLLLLLVLFTLTRLDGVPRSTPFIQALILGTGLVAARTFARVAESDRRLARRPPDGTSEHIVMIGAGQLTALYLKLLSAYLPGQKRAIGILDTRASFIGRKLAGVPVVGTPEQLDTLISEYAVHGIRTNCVLIGGDPDLLSASALKELQRVCAHWNVSLDFVPRLMGLWDTESRPVSDKLLAESTSLPITLPRYLVFKPFLDIVAALGLIVILSPLILLTAGLVFIDVGTPVLFWQQRMGRGGRTFLVYKFRTLRAPFDWQGRSIAHEERISAIGQLLRKTRLDELPQLLNVFTGEMALIGPRPLLPEDQPSNVATRLMVRPGLTGWAQVNGGTLLTAEEKHALDAWYIENASLWLDLKILLTTIRVVLTGERRSGPLNRTEQSTKSVENHPPRLLPAGDYKNTG